MKQASLKLKSYVENADIVNNGNLQSRILNVIFLSLGILGLAYVFILGNMVWNIVERKTLQAEERVLANAVGDLELEYISRLNEIDLTLSSLLGFREAKTKFTTRQALSFSSTGEFLGNLNSGKNEI